MSVTYQVVVEYKTKGNLSAELPAMTGNAGALAGAIARSKGEAASFESRISAVGSALKAAAGGLAEAFTGAVERAGDVVKTLGMMAGGAAIGAAIYGVGHLNTELEQTNLSLAAIFNANGLTKNFNDAMRLSADEVAKMKTDVKSLPGDFGQLAEIMRQIAPAAAQAGASPDKIRQLSGRGMLIGSILGVDQATTARELGMLLSGRAGAHNILGTRLGLTGDSARAFNKKSPADELKEVEGLFARFAPAAEAFSHSWAANFTTLKDSIKYGLLAPATSPLFERVKQTVIDVNAWFDRNQAGVAVFVGRLGDGLAHAWTRGTEIFQEWLPAIRTFAHAAYNDIADIWRRIEPTVARIGEIIKDSLGDGTALKHIEEILKLYGALKLRSALAPAMGGAFNLLSSLGGLGGGAGAAGAAEGAAGGAGLAITAPAAVAVAAAMMLAKGEIEAVADSSSKYHKEAVEAAGHLATAGHALANDFTPATKGWNDTLEWLGVQATNLGAHLMGGVDAIAHFGSILDDLSLVLEQKTSGTWAESMFWGMSDQQRADNAAMGKYKRSLAGDVYTPDRDDNPLDFTHSAASAAAAGSKDEAAKGKTPAAAAHNVTINNYFTISSNHEPSRIARDVVAHIAETRRFPTQSRHVKQPSGTT
jgi:hypothetical protein